MVVTARPLLFVALILGLGSVRATPLRIPTDDDEVIGRIHPLTAAERRLRAVRGLAADPATSPLELPEALVLARALINQSRALADPRPLGQAQTVLGPWWSGDAAPASVLLLRATIEQSRHDFPAALDTLKLAARREPRSVGVWLTTASIHTVLGNYKEARVACVHLARLGDPGTALTAAAAVASLTGDAVASLHRLEEWLDQRPGPASGTPDEQATRVWSLTLAAEIADRLGLPDVAARRFSEARRSSPRDPYLLGAEADFLLGQGRFTEVIERLAPFPQVDALLIRRAEAQAASGDRNGAARSTVLLDERFAAARERGNQVHRREEARFQLNLKHETRPALALALANWDVQREPADLRLLASCAVAANNAAALATVRDWIATHHLEDVHVTTLLATTPAGGGP